MRIIFNKVNSHNYNKKTRPFMNIEEIQDFFNLKGPSYTREVNPRDCESHFIDLVSNWESRRGSIAIYLMKNYKSRYSAEFQQLILKYVTLLLLNPGLCDQSDQIVLAGPTIILPHYCEVKVILGVLALQNECKSLFRPVIIKLGLNITKNCRKAIEYIRMLAEILQLGNVYKIFRCFQQSQR